MIIVLRLPVVPGPVDRVQHQPGGDTIFLFGKVPSSI
jgi:hypothetical protein